MLVNNIIEADIINYKKISMFIACPTCTGKCWKELGLDCSICQNNSLRYDNPVEISERDIVEMYLSNPLTEAIVLGGLEPLDRCDEVYKLIFTFRQFGVESPIIIYTGYREDEEPVQDLIAAIKSNDFHNIIIKVGRYIPNKPSRKDPVLGVTLASDNQYAIVI